MFKSYVYCQVKLKWHAMVAITFVYDWQWWNYTTVDLLIWGHIKKLTNYESMRGERREECEVTYLQIDWKYLKFQHLYITIRQNM